MQLVVNDGNGNAQTIIVPGLEDVTDTSGTIAQTNRSQSLLPANLLRSGWLLQNLGSTIMLINELNVDPTANPSWEVQPGSFFPPPNFPHTTGAILIAGTQGDAYTLRTW